MKKKLIGVMVFFFAILPLIAIIYGTATGRIPKDPETTATTEPPTVEEVLQKQIEKAIGDKTYRTYQRKYIEKVRSIKISNNILFLEISADENIFGRNMEKSGIQYDIIKIMKVIDIPDNVEMISFKFYYPARDENYNYYEAVVMSGWINKEKFAINWENVDETDLPNIMFDVYWHPNF